MSRAVESTCSMTRLTYHIGIHGTSREASPEQRRNGNVNIDLILLLEKCSRPDLQTSSRS